MKREKKKCSSMYTDVFQFFFVFVLFFFVSSLLCMCSFVVCLFLIFFPFFYFLTVAIISTDITSAHTLPNLQRMIVAIEFSFVNFVAYNADGNQTNG